MEGIQMGQDHYATLTINYADGTSQEISDEGRGIDMALDALDQENVTSIVLVITKRG